MQKEKVLVCDSKGVFLKMFKRRFKEEFDFIENSFLDETVQEIDRIVYVIHNHSELLNFLSNGKRGATVLVCLFNIQFYTSLSSFNLTNNLLLFDESKTRVEILQVLKSFFSGELNSQSDKKPLKISPKKIREYYRAIYFLM